MSESSTVVLTFEHSRCASGEDVASIIAAQLPDADIRAQLDERGAVASYELTLHFTDADKAADAAFRLRDLFDEMGIAAEFPT